MRYEISTCSRCGKKFPIINRRYWLCQECNKIRLHGNTQKIQPKIKKKRFNDKFSYDTRWGFTGEVQMYNYIWDTRSHVSQISGQPVPFLSPINMLHLLPKGLGKYPHFKLNPDNVIIGTEYEHHLMDEGTVREREKYREMFPHVDWGYWDEKVNELKQEYRKLY